MYRLTLFTAAANTAHVYQVPTLGFGSKLGNGQILAVNYQHHIVQ